MDDSHPLIGIILFLVIILIDIIFSGMNVALSSMSESTLEKRAEGGDAKASRMLQIIEKPMAFLSTVDMVQAAVSILAGSFVVRPQAIRLAGVLQSHLQIGVFPAKVISFLIIIVVVIYLITVVGILFPKRIAIKHAEKWTGALMGVVSVCTAICRPFVLLVNASVNVLVRLAGINPKDIEENVTEEEIIMMVSEGNEQGVIEDSEAEMISNIFEFDDKNVADIMTHRRHIVSIDASMQLEEAARVMAAERFTRYPVFEDDEDVLVGIVHFKDVMRLILDGEGDRTVGSIMREPMFVPDTQSINTLFRDMQARKIHMAIVVDEYGQSCGLVAMEDILEEIVGNIMDEYDTDERYIQTIGGAYIMKGLTPLEMITDLLGIEFDGDFDTLNGYLISKLDHIPTQNEGASIDVGGYTFRIIAVADNAVSMAKVTKITAGPGKMQVET